MKEEDGTIAPQSGGKRRVRALYDFKPQKMGDMRFQKGEVMMLLVNSTHDNWWAVRHADGREGFVPSNYVTLDDTVTSGADDQPVTDDVPPETPDGWEIDPDKLSSKTKVDTWMYGTVWKGKYLGCTDVAIRSQKADCPNTTVPHDEFMEAVDLLKKFRHENLEHVFGVCTKSKPMCLVTEWMSHGSLLKYLRQKKEADIDLPCLIDMAAQVASGMSYLERHGYIHTDLAARSVLVGDNNVVRVTYFGEVRATNEDGEYLPEGAKKVPIKWTALEAVLYGKFSTMSTVWSFGVLLQEMMTRGQVPYPGMTNREALDKVENGYRMAKCPSTPELLYKLQLACWEEEPKKRPTFGFLFNCLSDYSTLTKSVSTSS
ncbi:tyrosine-protein kinase SRK3-like [Babylonia areolata]|uniref:tyrosine-protein kinase SRK3-like n=1 Tax=Babylonia areolata TaxID=304850 RepID=UPI003FD385BF